MAWLNLGFKSPWLQSESEKVLTLGEWLTNACFINIYGKQVSFKRLVRSARKIRAYSGKGTGFELPSGIV
jgi:hypothetical protein